MIIIPARLNSTRFDKKILTQIDGMPMFVKTALIAKDIDECLVAVDDESVYEIAVKYGLKAMITSKEHKSGTQRLGECVTKLRLSDEVIVNIQADEPFLEKQNLQKFVDFSKKMLNEDAFMCSCYKLSNDALDENAVKVVCDNMQNAMYFSRSAIPFYRNHKQNAVYKIHLGIYSYKASSLLEYAKLNSSLDDIESLEQLKALENGKKIKMLEISTKSIGIDTIDDLQRAKETFGF